MMQVLYVFTFMYSLSTWDESGTLDKELRIFKELYKKKGVEFTFLTYGNEKDKEFQLEKYGINVIPIFKKVIPKNKFINFIYPIFFILKNRSKFKKYDLIKQNQLNGVWLSLIMKKILKTPLIVRTGYDTYRFSLYERKSIIKQKIYFKLTQISLRYSNLFTVTSISDLNFLDNYKVNQYEAKLRKNWVEKFDIKSINKRSKDKVLSVGRMEYQKNYMRLLEDFQKTDFIIDIVGKGSEFGDLKKFVQKNNINVNFLGKIENLKLSELYDDYLFFASSSLFEGNPKALLEAMSHGCIPIVSNIENHREIVENNFNGYLINDGDSFVKVINSLLTNENKLRSLSENAAKEVVKNNSLENLVDQTFDDYLDLTI